MTWTGWIFFLAEPLLTAAHVSSGFSLLIKGFLAGAFILHMTTGCRGPAELWMRMIFVEAMYDIFTVCTTAFIKFLAAWIREVTLSNCMERTKKKVPARLVDMVANCDTLLWPKIWITEFLFYILICNHLQNSILLFLTIYVMQNYIHVLFLTWSLKRIKFLFARTLYTQTHIYTQITCKCRHVQTSLFWVFYK